jgi:hypothetical protein
MIIDILRNMPRYVMSDGRGFTDYQPSCTLNKQIQDKYSLTANTHQYRYFLQQNAEKLIQDFAASSNAPSCTLCPVCQMALESKK